MSTASSTPATTPSNLNGLQSSSSSSLTGLSMSGPMSPNSSLGVGFGSTTANPYTVVVSSKSYHLSLQQINYDSPNLFSEHFLSKPSQNSVSSVASMNTMGASTLFTSSFAQLTNPNSNTNANASPNPQSTVPLPLIIPHKNHQIFELIVLHLSGYEILPLDHSQCPAGMNMSNFENNLVTDLRFYRLRGLLEKLAALKALMPPTNIPKSPITQPLVWCNDDVEPFLTTGSGQVHPPLRQVGGPFEISKRPLLANNTSLRYQWPESVRFTGRGLIIADNKMGDTGRPLLLKAKDVQVQLQLDLTDMCIHVSFKFLVAADRKLLLAKVPTLLASPTWINGESLQTASITLNNFATSFHQILTWYFVRTRPLMPPSSNVYARYDYLSPLDRIIGVPTPFLGASVTAPGIVGPEDRVLKMRVPCVAEEMLFYVLTGGNPSEGYIVPVWINAKTMPSFWTSVGLANGSTGATATTHAHASTSSPISNPSSSRITTPGMYEEKDFGTLF